MIQQLVLLVVCSAIMIGFHPLIFGDFSRYQWMMLIYLLAGIFITKQIFKRIESKK
jgi:O-antigen ligase